MVISLSLSLLEQKTCCGKYEYILVVLVYNNICSCTYTEPHQPTKPSCWFTGDCDPSKFQYQRVSSLWTWSKAIYYRNLTTRHPPAWYGRIGWKEGYFGGEGIFPVLECAPVRNVDLFVRACPSRWREMTESPTTFRQLD